MVRKTNSEFVSRRDIMKSMGAASGVAFASGITAGRPTGADSISRQEVQDILQKEKVKTLLDSVGKVSPKENKARKFEDVSGTTVYGIPTKVGEIFYGYRSNEGGRETEAGIALGASLSTNKIMKVPKGHKKKLNAPLDELPLDRPAYHIVDDNDEIVQTRVATQNETETIAQKVGIDASNLLPLISSKRDDIVVLVGNDDDRVSKMSENQGRYLLSSVPDSAAYEVLNEEEIAKTDVTTPITTLNECDQKLGDCAQSVGASSACIAGCATAGALTLGLAFAACALCTAGFSFHAGTECAEYYEDCL